MKNITLNFMNTPIHKLLAQFDKNKLLVFAMISPLLCFIFLLDWDYRILIFLVFGYAAAFTGFLFAKTRLGYELLTKDEDLFLPLLAEHVDRIVIVHQIENSTIAYVTPYVEKAIGYSPSYLLRRQSTFFVHPEDRRKFQKLVSKESLELSTDLKISLRVLEKGKDYIWMELTAEPIWDERNRITHAVIKFFDVQERKEMEKVSRLFAEELMRKEPEMKVDAKVSDQLISLMTSHELKEPLRTMKSYIGLLENRSTDNFDREGKECLGFVYDAADRLEGMIGDITDFFKMGGGNLKLKRVDTQMMVKNIIKLFQTKIKEKNASIIVGILPTVIADPRQIQHLFQNLIENALKYTKGKAEIRISCKKKTNSWEFEVRDNGIGVEENFQQEIFSAFRRLHTIDEYGGGTGIGLTICQKVVDNHGGNIWIRSGGKDKGSQFLFSIPFEASARSIKV